MKPISLEFQGIKSYISKTSIDFTKLISEGIFGIFGNTGSGKSTILDCILLALYGRLSKVREAVDFINLSTLSAYVDFAFEMKVLGVEKKFRVRRDYKLKLPRKAGSHKAVLSEINNDGETPIAEGAESVSAKIESIIGLDFEDFEKCIILPQGDFAAFVRLARSKRLEMISSLFNLQKYGEKLIRALKDKIRTLEFQKINEENKLKLYEDATQENLSNTKNEIEKLELLIETQNIKTSKNKEIYLKIKENYERHNNLESYKKQLLDLSVRQDEIKFKSMVLSKIESVMMAKMKSDDIAKFSKMLNELEHQKNDLSLRISKLNENKIKLENDRLIIQNNENLHNDFLSLKSQLDYIEEDIKLNEKRNLSLNQMRKDLISLNEQNLILDNKKTKFVLDLNLLSFDIKQEKLKQQIEEVLERLEGASNDVVLTDEISFLNSIKEHVFDEVKILILERLKNLESKFHSEKCISIKTLIDNLKSLYDESDNISKKNAKLLEEISKCEAEGDRLSDRIDDLTQKGVEVKNEFLQVKQKIDGLLNGKDYDKYKKEVCDKLVELENFAKNFESFEKKIIEDEKVVESLRSKITAESSQINKQLESAKSEYAEILRVNFKGEKEFLGISKYCDSIEEIKSEVEKYNQKIYFLNSNISELTKLIEGEVCDEKSFNEARINYDNSEAILKENRISLEILKKNYEKLSQNFSNRCIIKTTLKNINKEYNINYSLFDVVKSNGLLEFIAEEYLKEISTVAKSTLITLSDGRLGLRYDGDFYVEDNLIGGQLRRVDTVSGGELFLVSLSLALSLSKSICAKSQKPIEFFFLDEGFGSLDKELVETVMDSLEKLKNSQLTIGVISHVESLKERISAKICVNSASEQGGSTLSLTI